MPHRCAIPGRTFSTGTDVNLGHASGISTLVMKRWHSVQISADVQSHSPTPESFRSLSTPPARAKKNHTGTV